MLSCINFVGASVPWVVGYTTPGRCVGAGGGGGSVSESVVAKVTSGGAAALGPVNATTRRTNGRHNSNMQNISTLYQLAMPRVRNSEIDSDCHTSHCIGEEVGVSESYSSYPVKNASFQYFRLSYTNPIVEEFHV